MHLVIDLGNSRNKIALFQDGEMLKHAVWNADEEFSFFDFLEGQHPDSSILSSVRKEYPQALEELLERIPSPYHLGPASELPIRIGFDDPSTLGADRLANAVAAHSTLPAHSALVIDMGTCITYDRIDDGVLIGGAISPGIRMRANAMHRSTGRLPLVQLQGTPERNATDTEAALRSGIYYGVLDEIKGRIQAFESDRPDGSVVLTGGDLSLVGKELKKGIFADPFLTLRGLDAILDEHMAKGNSGVAPSDPS
jgi:type III pantothenate kinase